MQADKKSHTHSKGHNRAIINRLSKSIGHLQSIKTMIENGRDCSEIVIQLAAVRGEIASTAKAILKEHLSHCVVHAIQDGDEKKIEEFKKAMDSFLKY